MCYGIAQTFLVCFTEHCHLKMTISPQLNISLFVNALMIFTNISAAFTQMCRNLYSKAVFSFLIKNFMIKITVWIAQAWNKGI